MKGSSLRDKSEKATKLLSEVNKVEFHTFEDHKSLLEMNVF